MDIITKNKTVALVGPSPNIAEKGLGKLIDSYDVVVRIKKGFPVPTDVQKDYGSKTNIIMSNLRQDNGTNDLSETTIRAIKKNKIHICVPYPVGSPKDRFQLNKSDQLMVKNYHKFHCHDVKMIYPLDFVEWSELSKKLGSKPTIGLLAVHTLLKTKLKKLFVIGFSFRKEFSPQNATCPNSNHDTQNLVYSDWYKNQKQISHSLRTINDKIHDVDKEIRFITKLSKRDTRLSFETTCHQMLSRQN